MTSSFVALAIGGLLFLIAMRKVGDRRCPGASPTLGEGGRTYYPHSFSCKATPDPQTGKLVIMGMMHCDECGHNRRPKKSGTSFLLRPQESVNFTLRVPIPQEEKSGEAG